MGRRGEGIRIGETEGRALGGGKADRTEDVLGLEKPAVLAQGGAAVEDGQDTPQRRAGDEDFGVEVPAAPSRLEFKTSLRLALIGRKDTSGDSVLS